MVAKPTLPLLKAHRSSRAWLARQFSDPYVKKRLQHPSSYRSRSAFKLIELDNLYSFLSRPNVNVVIDLGAAPGGWSQVVAGKFGFRDDGAELLAAADQRRKASRSRAKKTGPSEQASSLGSWSSPGPATATSGTPKSRKTIIAVDLLPMAPIRGVQALQMNFLHPAAENMVKSFLPSENAKADVIMSDMAANVSGVRVKDVEASLDICNAVYQFAKRNLNLAEPGNRSRNGVLLMKYFTHPLTEAFCRENLKTTFNHVYTVKPPASRDESSEAYWLCMGWKGSREFQSEKSRREVTKISGLSDLPDQ